MARFIHLDAASLDATALLASGEGDPIAPYRNLTDAALRAMEAKGQLGRFIAEGPLVVREALVRSREEVDAGRPALIQSLLVDALAMDAHRDVLALVPEGVPIYAVARDVVQGIVGFQFHRGILACGVRPPDHDWRALAREASALVVLENLANHDNVGSIFRSVAALAGRSAGILITHGTCDPLYRKSLRVSIGHALRIRFARIETWPDSLGELAAMGFAPLALTPSAAADDVAQVGRRLAGRPMLLVGAEGPGLCEATMRHPAVGLARIPMAPGVDSLNAGVAAAVAMSHLMRPSSAERFGNGWVTGS